MIHSSFLLYETYFLPIFYNMKNAIVINCISLSEYAFKPLPSGLSSFQKVMKYAETLPDFKKIVMLVQENEKNKYLELTNTQKLANQAEISIVSHQKWDSSLLFETFMQQDCANIFYVFGDTPFLDTDLAKKMYDDHINYSAQYSFSDGGPLGIACEIVAVEIADALKVLSDKEKLPVKRDTIFSVIQRDINSFDIETHLTEKDLRMLRITLAADSKRNFETVQLFDKSVITTEEKIINITPLQQQMLRTLPAYYLIQITDKCFQSCAYCPYPKINPNLLESSRFMEFEKYCAVLEKISSFSEDAVIGLSLWGEPAAHPDIEKFILKTIEYKNFSLVIETSGVGWQNRFINQLAEKISDKQKLIWILSLDTDVRAVYQQLRGRGFDEAIAMANTLMTHFPDTAYIQAVRMNENDDVLEKFYKSWKADGRKVIVQKYDSFCGFLPDRKVTDISPLKRIPCWHIKRDIPVLIDGAVTLCREDINKNFVLGNIFNDSLEKIWQAGEKYYIEHLEEKYCAMCDKCDEYYTYNF